jgi:hypothetical protein
MWWATTRRAHKILFCAGCIAATLLLDMLLYVFQQHRLALLLLIAECLFMMIVVLRTRSYSRRRRGGAALLDFPPSPPDTKGPLRSLYARRTPTTPMPDPPRVRILDTIDLSKDGVEIPGEL